MLLSPHALHRRQNKYNNNNNERKVEGVVINKPHRTEGKRALNRSLQNPMTSTPKNSEKHIKIYIYIFVVVVRLMLLF